MSEVDFRTFKREARNYLIGISGTLLIAIVAFYFNTTYTIQNHTQRIEKLETEVAQRATVNMVLQIKQDQDAQLQLIREDTKFIREWIMTNTVTHEL